MYRVHMMQIEIFTNATGLIWVCTLYYLFEESTAVPNCKPIVLDNINSLNDDHQPIFLYFDIDRYYKWLAKSSLTLSFHWPTCGLCALYVCCAYEG